MLSVDLHFLIEFISITLVPCKGAASWTVRVYRGFWEGCGHLYQWGWVLGGSLKRSKENFVENRSQMRDA